MMIQLVLYRPKRALSEVTANRVTHQTQKAWQDQLPNSKAISSSVLQSSASSAPAVAALGVL